MSNFLQDVARKAVQELREEQAKKEAEVAAAAAAEQPKESAANELEDAVSGPSLQWNFCGKWPCATGGPVLQAAQRYCKWTCAVLATFANGKL